MKPLATQNSLTDVLAHFDRAAMEYIGVPVAEQPYSPGHGLRVTHRDNAIKGYTDIVRFSDDFFMLISDTIITKETQESYFTSGWIALHFRMNGRTRLLMENGTGQDRDMSFCHVVCYPDQFLKTEITLDPGSKFQWIAILFRPTALVREFALDLDKHPKEFRLHALGKGREYYGQKVPFTQDISGDLYEVLECEYRGKLRWVFYRAKAIELICKVIARMPQGQQPALGPALVIRPQDVQRLHAARSLIADNISHHYTIQDVARHVGLNRRKLTYGFMQLFGVSVFKFGLSLRMEAALQMLRDDIHNIDHISFVLGYENPRNFSIAFKRHYGSLPKDARALLRAGAKLGYAKA